MICDGQSVYFHEGKEEWQETAQKQEHFFI